MNNNQLAQIIINRLNSATEEELCYNKNLRGEYQLAPFAKWDEQDQAFAVQMAMNDIESEARMNDRTVEYVVNANRIPPLLNF